MSDLIRQTKEYADLSEVVTATYYDEEHEEWSVRSITIKDVLDAVCDDYTVFLSAQKWIPVTPETMPEDYGTYICTCFDGYANRVTFVKWQNKLKQWILNGSRSYWKVIAWMPLPEPFKGGDDECI